jgi:hypothetical protein
MVAAKSQVDARDRLHLVGSVLAYLEGIREECQHLEDPERARRIEQYLKATQEKLSIIQAELQAELARGD